MENTGCDPYAGHGPEWYRERLDYMAEFMTAERLANFRSVLDRRTRWMTICTESTFHPQNASALVRTCEAFGLQEIHAIEALCRFRPNVNVVKGTDKWVDIRRYGTAAEAVSALRSRGYRIIAATPHADDTPPALFDVAAGPFALVFGTEHAGITEEVTDAADGFIKIPMYGFVESLNVSASAAIIMHTLSERMRADESIPWQLAENDKLALLLKWTMASVKDSKRILRLRFPG